MAGPDPSSNAYYPDGSLILERDLPAAVASGRARWGSAAHPRAALAVGEGARAHQRAELSRRTG